MLVAENGKIIAVNEAAAALFVMPVEELLGQRWAGLDAHTTLVGWRGYWHKLAGGETVEYRTDIETSRQYLRPIRVELRRVNDQAALLTLEDLIAPDITGNEFHLLDHSIRLGYWSYNRVDGRLQLSPVCRSILGLEDESISKSEIGKVLRRKMAEDDYQRMSKLATRLLTSPGEATQTFVVEVRDQTARFSFTCRSVGNELHVTHLYGAVRQLSGEAMTEEGQQSEFATLASFSLERARDMIFWTRPDGSIRYANGAVSAQLGYGTKELSGMAIRTIAPSFDEPARQKFWEELRREKSLELEYVLVSKDGTSIDIASTVNYIRFGEEEYACSINRDITQKKRVAARQRLMEFTFDQVQDTVIWSYPDGAILGANRTFFMLTDFQQEALPRLSYSQLFPGGNLSREELWEELRSGKSPDYEADILLANGKHLPVRIRHHYVQNDGRELVCTYARDIRSDREKDRTLLLSKLALDTAADGFVWIDGEMRVQYANQTIKDLLPAGSGSPVGKDVRSVFPNIDVRQIGPGSSQDFELQTRGGELRHMNLTCSPLEHAGHRYFVLSARDVSALAQERQELETAFTEIEVMRDRLRDENITLREDNDSKYNVNNIITVSPKYQKILEKVGQVADVDTTVLITGETGTGKELLARAVHQLSRREDFPLIKVNCATLPENLIESELFGHEKGSFTGAVSRKKGRFEMADRGTIFLDEIGELPLDLQAKLLRVLQEDEFERLGGEQTIRVDVRLIAATNRNLEEMVRQGKFREDLYYRLNVFPIHNLPLRDRPEDVPVLIEYFTNKYAKRQGKSIRKINTADIKRLSRYDFPGNIRELENIIERSVVLCHSDTLSIDFFHNPRTPKSTAEPFLSFEDMQRKYIIKALKRTGGRVTGPTGAGKLLDLNDRTLVSKIKKLGIEKRDYLV